MYKQLTSQQRYTICVLLQKKMSLTFIADTIGVSVSTISREIKRNSTKDGVYKAKVAISRTKKRRTQNPGNRTISPYIRSFVFELIRKKQWSAEQISGWLKREKGLNVSKSTIYNWIAKSSPHFTDNIRKHLRQLSKKKRKTSKQNKVLIPNRVSISERPNKDYGERIGDWEMDTIVGKNGKGVVLTLVEKKSGYAILRKLKEGKKAIPLSMTAIEVLKETNIPVRTITTDNGLEFAAHEMIAKQLNTKIYFTHPYCSWEKGAIENLNGLIRQYIPKRTDFRGVPDKMIQEIQDKLNDRPRKRNGYIKPKDYIKEYSI